MTPDQEIQLIQDWIDLCRRQKAMLDGLRKTLGVHEPTYIHHLAWEAENLVVKAIAALIGDDDGWLEWFAFECQFGASPSECHVGGRKFRPATAAEIHAIIKMHE